MQDRDRQATRGRGPWLGAVALVVLAGIAVPYGLMPAEPGATLALYWTGFGLVVAVLIAVGVLRWRTGA